MSEKERIKTGQKLKEAREYLGLSQLESATELGIPRSAISFIENGRRKIDLVELKKLAKLYQRPVSFFTGDGEMKLPKISELTGLQRATKGLSKNDVREVLKFAEFLKSRSSRR
ncbi:MAG: helix-turn-helix transcriptional regulator [Bacteriovoracales bacterium]|nr:helix-turn-helix transcriptional regulator [Bacteriovoracales bacterium]